jgi:hypothetical protein
MKHRIRIFGGGLAIVTLSAFDGDVTQSQLVTPIGQSAAAHAANAGKVAAPRANSAADTKKGRYAMGAN